MKKPLVKPYIIHIMAVPQVTEAAFRLPPDRFALIVCTGRTTPFIESDFFLYKLMLPFHDVRKRYIGSFTSAHAKAVLRFLEDLPDTVTDLYICCSKGVSRSPGLAAALLRLSGRSDKEVWENPYFLPNEYVYKRLCTEAGLFTPKSLVRRKVRKNRRQIKKARRRGNAGKYDRPQYLPPNPPPENK